MTTWQRAAVALLAGLAWQASAGAQALRDPTQPPQLVAPASSASATAQPVSSEPRLQSVLISTRGDGRRVAVIDGESLRVGDTFHEFKVVKISADKVVLRQGKLEQVLTMPEPSTAKAEAPAAKAGSAAKPDEAVRATPGISPAEEAMMKALGVAKPDATSHPKAK